MSTTRRQFLQQSSAVLFLAAIPRVCHGAEQSAPSPLGMGLYGMKTLPVMEALRQCARIGYRNVELCIDPEFPGAPAKMDAVARRALRAQAASLGLGFSGMMLNLNLALAENHAGNLEAIKTAAGFAHDLVPTAPPPIETVFRGKPAEWDALKAGMVQRLGEWADAARAGGVRFVVKAHVSMVVNSPARLLWLLQQVNRPEIRVAFDYSHFEVQGIPLEESWSALRSYVDFVHVKDTAGDPKKPIFLLPGEGHTDYVSYSKLLRRTGYAGPVVVEVSTQIFSRPGYDPVKAAEASYAALAPAWAASQS